MADGNAGFNNKGYVFLKLGFRATRGKNDQSYVAVDLIEFLDIEMCSLMPPEAEPSEPTTTTPIPTEPPGRK